MSRERRYYCVYIMGSLSGTLYIGLSGNLHKRVFQHKFHHFEGFTDRYDIDCLLYWESYDDVHKALARETQLKGWTRAKKNRADRAAKSALGGLSGRVVSVDEVQRQRRCRVANARRTNPCHTEPEQPNPLSC